MRSFHTDSDARGYIGPLSEAPGHVAPRVSKGTLIAEGADWVGSGGAPGWEETGG